MDVHANLPESLVAELDRVAAERAVRRVTLLREAVEEYLAHVEADRIEQGMRDYVEALAPLSGQLVAETEGHTIERLLEEVEW